MIVSLHAKMYGAANPVLSIVGMQLYTDISCGMTLAQFAAQTTCHQNLARCDWLCSWRTDVIQWTQGSEAAPDGANGALHGQMDTSKKYAAVASLGTCAAISLPEPAQLP